MSPEERACALRAAIDKFGSGVTSVRWREDSLWRGGRIDAKLGGKWRRVGSLEGCLRFFSADRPARIAAREGQREK